jgi:hypothetical protein
VVVGVIGAAFDDVSVSDIGLPPVGVNVNVMLNAVGMNIDVLPMTCAGVNSPFPFTTTMTVWPLHIALIRVALFALVGSAVATGTMTAEANARQAAAVSRRRFIALPFRSCACSRNGSYYPAVVWAARRGHLP